MICILIPINNITIKLSEEIHNPIKTCKFLLHLTHWEKYARAESEIFSHMSSPLTSSSNKEAISITKAIRTAPNVHIPQSKISIKIRKRPVPWFPPTITILRNLKMKSWQLFKGNPPIDNLLIYKRHNCKIPK